MKAFPDDSPLPFCYNIAGTRVYTNREGTTNDAFTPQVDLKVYFTDEQIRWEETNDDGELTYPPSQWHTLPGFESSPAILRRDGKSAIIQETDRVPDTATQLRRVAPFAAALQGVLVLHAASILCVDGLIAFIGPSAVGKSTLARRLSQRGYPSPSDDLLPCQMLEKQVHIPLDPIQPLSALYFLGRDDAPGSLVCTSISRHDCWLALLKHGFGELGAPDVWEKQFLGYHHIASLVPAYQLTLPDDLSLLEECVRELIPLLEGTETYLPTPLPVEAIS